ncbi:MAG: carbamoyltransferase HypF [Pseudomonadota bacterium]
MTETACIRVRGQVQGVGFRPFIWQLAKTYSITGEVLNDAEGVLIRARGTTLAAFEADITLKAPPLAEVDRVERVPGQVPHSDSFEIVASGAAGADTRVTPDAATCPACVSEIGGSGRRQGYAFTNCTHCGPRFTILRGLPYDRAKTSMAPFDMCADCAAEYADPGDRRFHAQPIACPVCGPELWLEPAGNGLPEAAARLRRGEILAIKGLGGFHLACDAANRDAVALLRMRKRRPSKPFALMGTLSALSDVADLSRAEALLQDPAAPIVLVPSRPEALPEAVAPGMAHLGVMLPYTPLHHLLLGAFGGVLVMTSGNLSGEPQVVGNSEAREKLAGFADSFVMHNRDIARRLDDGVEALGPSGPMVLRRARGRVPGTLDLPERFSDAQVVAYGGQMKSAICLAKGGQAMLSHHLGELDEALTWEEFLKADADLAALFDHAPEAVAVDLHPDFRATRHGRARAEAEGLRLLEVQHHHAHMAAQLGEAGWTGTRAIGLVMDGLGLGPDGTVWGGEVLLGDYRRATRAACLSPAPLVGGDRAQAEPWRNALVRLDAAGLETLADSLFADQPRDALRRAAEAGLNAPLSSSAGRLFDSVAACLGLCPARQSYEGEAAMRLQALAHGVVAGAYPMEVGDVIDPTPLFHALAQDLARGEDRAKIAARAQAGIGAGFARAARQQADAKGCDTVALSGGCFQNTALLAQVADQLSDLRLCLPGQVPANDGGLAFGQTLVALAQLESG